MQKVTGHSILLWLLASGSSAHASQQQGVDWLKQAINNSSVNNPSIASDVQVKNEWAYTLSLLDSYPSNIDVSVGDDQSTEALSRALLLAAKSGADSQALLQSILVRQNSDGGFGHLDGWQSDVLDSAWILMALAYQPNIDLTVISKLKGYLYKQTLNNGQIANLSLESSLEASSLILLASKKLAPAPDDLAFLNFKQQVSLWLSKQQLLNGTWGQDPYLTGYALGALNGVSNDANMRSLSVAYLLSQQAADGSWSQDPFLTAVIVRALSEINIDNTPIDTILTNQLMGRVLAAGSSYPLVGVKVVIDGQQILTDSQGNFSLLTVPSGTQNIQFSLEGHQSNVISTNIPKQGRLNIGSVFLATAPQTATVLGKVLDATANVPIANAQLTIGSLSVVTDSQGYYQLTNVPVGVSSIAITATGYTTAQTTLNLSSGTVQFQANLYKEGVQPAITPPQLLGKVTTTTGQALADVMIKIDGQVVTQTGTTGSFIVNVTEGEHLIELQKQGYSSISQKVIFQNGTNVTVGTLILPEFVDGNVIFGRVIDKYTQQPIAGAFVEVIGFKTVSTDVNGYYRIEGVGQLLETRVSSTAYNSYNVTLSLNGQGLVSKDFELIAQSNPDIALTMSVSKERVEAVDTPVEISVTYENKGVSHFDISPILQVVDTDNKIVTTASAYASINDSLPMGSISLEQGESRTVVFKWNSGQLPAGRYNLLAKAALAGSFSGTNAAGFTIAEKATAIELAPFIKVVGFTRVSPPIQRANNIQPVAITAVFQNQGNVLVDSNVVKAQVVNNNQIVAEISQTVPTLKIQALSRLDFGTWTGTKSGHYTVNIVNQQNQQIAAPMTIYIGDAATGAFTVNKTVVPTGHQSVQGNISLKGVSSLGATIDDNELTGIIKFALSKSVPFNDAESAAWAQRNSCAGCHIATQAIVGGELNNKFVPRNAEARNLLLSMIKKDRQSDGSFLNTVFTPNTQTILDLWAMSSWEKTQDVMDDMEAAAKYLASRQTTTGKWVSDRQDAWWYDDYSLAALATYGFNHLTRKLTTEKQMVDIVTTLSSSTSNYEYLSVEKDESEQLFILALKNKTDYVILRKTNEGLEEFLTFGTEKVWGFKARNAKIYIAQSNQIKVFDYSGSIKATYPKTTPEYRSLDVAANGDVYVGTTGTIQKISQTGMSLFYNLGYEVKSIAISSDNKIIFLSPSLSGVYQYNNNTRVLLTSSSGVNGLASTKDGNILLMDNNGTRLFSKGLITKFSNTALRSVAYLNNDQYIAIANTDGTKLLNIALEKVNYSNTYLSQYNEVLNKSWSFWKSNIPAATDTDNLRHAYALLALGNFVEYFERNKDLTRANEARALITPLVERLRQRQSSSGGWASGVKSTNVSVMNYYPTVVDPLVTAIVGYSIAYARPAKPDEMMLKAINYELSQQKADGSWGTYMFSTKESATTWVSIFLPKALERLLSLNAQLYITTGASEHLSNPNILPQETLTQADGNKQYHWDFSNTYDDQSLTFDVLMDNLKANEQRLIVKEARLVFDSAVDSTEKMTNFLDIPSVTASAGLTLELSTDKLSYPANTLVGISNRVLNTNISTQLGKVHVALYTTTGDLVQDLGTTPFDNLTANNDVVLPATWNTGTIKPDTYLVKAELFDADGSFVVEKQQALNVTATGIADNLLSSQVSTNKLHYSSIDSVQIESRVNNLAINTALKNATVTTKVLDSQNQLIWSKQNNLTELAANNQQVYFATSAIANAVAAEYQVVLEVTNPSGQLLSQSSTRYIVDSTALTGVGVNGQLQLAALSLQNQTITQGDSLSINATVRNTGNSALQQAPIDVLIIDPVTTNILSQWRDVVDINQESQVNLQHTWPALAAYNQPVLVVIKNGFGQEQVLAQQIVKISKPVVTLQTITDKTQYGLNDPIVINEVIHNQSVVNLQQVKVTTLISQPNGQVVSESNQIVDINAQSQLPQTVNYTLNRAAAGQWQITTIIQDKNAIELNRQVYTFEVLSSTLTGEGLTGRLALPAQAVRGQSITMDWGLDNAGNSAYTDLPTRIELIDDQQQVIATLTNPVANLAVDTPFNQQSVWTVVGNYNQSLQARLLAEVANQWKVLANAPLQVLAPQVSEILTTSKTSYGINELLDIKQQIKNDSPVLLNNVEVTTLISRPDGLVVDTQQTTLNLAAQSGVEQPVSYQFNQADAGQWTITSIVQDEQSIELTRQVKTIEVQSTAITGEGISGTLTATPVEVIVGQDVTLALALNNRGNAALNQQVISLTINKVGSTTPVKVITVTVDSLAKASTVTTNANWTVTGQAGDVFSVVATTRFNGQVNTLASASFMAKAPEIAVELTPELAAQSRVLVYYSCGHDWYKGIKGWSFGDCHYSCFDQRSATLRAYLDSLKVNYSLVAKESDFVKAFRSGRYNQTWLLGAIEKLPKDMDEELHEAVHRGDALVTDGGVQTWYNHEIYDIVGVKYRGRLNFSNSEISLTAPVFSQTQAIGKVKSAGWPLYLKATTGTVTATYGANYCKSVEKDWIRDKEGEDKEFYGRHQLSYPAIISNQYGYGKGLSMAFDLIASLDQPTEKTKWLSLLDQSLSWTNPTVNHRVDYVPQELVAVRSQLKNAGTTAQSIRLQVTLPVGAVWMGTGTVDANRTVTQTITLAANSQQQVWLPILLPSLTGTHQLTIKTLSADGQQILSEKQQPFTVKGIDSRFAEVRIAFEQLALNKQDDKLRDKVVDEIRDAQYLWSKGRYQEALAELGDASAYIRNIEGRDVSKERLALDILMKGLSIQWFNAQR